jgi:hypothetical protein
MHTHYMEHVTDLNHNLSSTICAVDSEPFGHAQDLTFAQGLLISQFVYLAVFSTTYICIISVHIPVY